MQDEFIERLTALSRLVQTGVISEGEARRRVRQDPGMFRAADLGKLSSAVLGVAWTDRRLGCLLSDLVYEWAAAHIADPLALRATGQSFVRAATEVLTFRDDARLYERAVAAADAMGRAHSIDDYWGGMLRLAPYALDPVNVEYAVHREFRCQRMRWQHRRLSRSGPSNPDMPDAATELGAAVAHLTNACAAVEGQSRGMILAQLAFAEYCRHEAGGDVDLSVVDDWCTEAMALLPVNGPALACNRLFWLLCLRGRGEDVWSRKVQVPDVNTMPDGLADTVVVGTTAVRLLGELGFPEEAEQAIRMLVPLLDDVEMEDQRRFVELAYAHCIPGDHATCLGLVRAGPPTEDDEKGLSGWEVAAGRIHALVHSYDLSEEWAAEAVWENARNWLGRLPLPACTGLRCGRAWT